MGELGELVLGGIGSWVKKFIFFIVSNKDRQLFLLLYTRMGQV